MKITHHISWLVVLFTLLTSPLTRADKVVVKEGEVFKPQLAVKWVEDAQGVTLTLADKEDASLVAEQITAQVKGATAKVTVQGTIIITGIKLDALLEHLALLDIELDPLAALGGLGQGLAMAGPEAGGSIRASKPTALPFSVVPQAVFKPHDSDERFIARVTDIKRGEFPNVVLTLKIKRKPEEGSIKLKKKRRYQALVLMAGQGQSPDFTSPNNQENLSAWFLLAGDRVEGHVVKKVDDTVYLDYIKRIR